MIPNSPTGRPTLAVLAAAAALLAAAAPCDAGSAIYVMNENGSGLELLTDHTVDDREPAFSPDGTRIAFSSARSGSWNLHIMNSDGSNPQQITSGLPLDFPDVQGIDWHPDGSKLLFSIRVSNIWQLFEVEPDGSNLTQLTYGSLDSSFATYSPDGTKIYFLRNVPFNGTTSEVWVAEADGTGMQQLTSTPGTAASRYPSQVTVAGEQKIVFRRSRDLYLMDLDGTNQVNITNSVESELIPMAPRNLPDVLTVAVIAGSSPSQIWVMTADGTSRLQLTSGPYVSRHPFWWVPADGGPGKIAFYSHGPPTTTCQDSDEDGSCDDEDICPDGDDGIDTDADEVPDFCDLCPLDAANDADGDGVCGDLDECPGFDDTLDADYDGYADGCDVCPVDPFNDADADGLCANEDNCPLEYNPNQSDLDQDGLGDECDPDDDDDSIPDPDDNCPFSANPGQEDFDEDGAGDACDTDDDQDDVIDDVDECPYTELADIVAPNGCSIAQLCPCGNDWKNHGAYVRCVAQTSEAFVDLGLITELEKDAVVSAAAQSACGMRN